MSYQTLISATDLSRLIEQGGVLICDCRFDLGDPDAGHRAYLEATPHPNLGAAVGFRPYPSRVALPSIPDRVNHLIQSSD